MNKQKETLNAIEQYLVKLETDIKRIKLLVNQIVVGEYDSIPDDADKLQELASRLVSYNDDGGEIKVIEGVYDGYFMVGSDEKKYPVPMNYSSKTKLIPGDVLKLRILEDGKLVYKLIGPAPRKFIKASLSRTEDNKYMAITDEGQTYYLNQASVTFFKGNPGDELSIIVNPDNVGDYAAIEALISHK